MSILNFIYDSLLITLCITSSFQYYPLLHLHLHLKVSFFLHFFILSCSIGMLDRPRIVKEGNEGEEDEDEEDDEDEELPSYLREQSSDEEHAALYSKNKLNANGEPLTFPIFIFSSPVTIFFPFLSFSFSLLRLSRFTFDAFLPPPPPSPHLFCSCYSCFLLSYLA